MTDADDLERKSAEEVSRRQAEIVARATAGGGRPLRRGDFNERKWSDPPQSAFTGYSFQLRPRFPIVVREGRRERLGDIVGLHSLRGEERPQFVVAVAGRQYRLTRADGQPWATSPDARRATVPQPWVPVTARALDADAAAENWEVYTPFRFRPGDDHWIEEYERSRERR